MEQLGGQATPAVGLALGVERLLLLLETMGTPNSVEKTDIFVITDGEQYQTQALAIAESLRAADWKVVVYLGQGRMKAQFKHADKSGARFALILGENEVQEGAVSIKDLLEGTQKKVPENELVAALRVWAS